MRVKAGEFVKEIPSRFKRAVELLTLADWEKPEKIRLTPMERFKFAEAAWRVEQPPLVNDYLKDAKPVQVIEQMNRQGEVRFVVRYSQSDGEVDYTPQAIVPNWVAKTCPKDKRSFESMNWVV